MKVLLIQPKDSMENYAPKRPLLAQAYLAAALEKAGHKVAILDLRVRKVEKRFNSVLKEFNPDVLCISLASLTLEHAFDIMKKVKSQNPKTIVIAGGPEVTTLSESILPKSDVDFVVVGEGDFVLPKFLEKYEKNEDWKSIPGLGYKEEGKITINPRELPENLDDIPFPAWHLFNLKDYNKNPKRIQLPIMTARGCPHKCIFCTIPSIFVKYRYRSPKNVVDEIEYVNKRFGIDDFQVMDDNIGLFKDRVIGICDDIIKRKLKIRWVVGQGLTANSVNKDMMVKMSESGCTMVSIGVESVHDDVLANIKKPSRISTIENAIKICKEAGIKVKGFFIIGLPGSTFKKELDSIEIFKRTGIDMPRYSHAVPMPQTELYEWAKKNAKPVMDIETSHTKASQTLGTLKTEAEEMGIVYETDDFPKEERIKAYRICTSEAEKWTLQNMLGKPLGYLAWKLSRYNFIRYYGEKIVDRLGIF